MTPPRTRETRTGRARSRTTAEYHAARDAKLTELSDRLEAAVGRLVSGEEWAAAVAFAARFRSRSFGNTLLIFAQHQDAYEKGRVPDPVPSYVAGFKQWNALGRHVVKGQPGYMIFAPVTRRFASTNPTDPESWRGLDRGERPRPGEAIRSRMVAVKPAYVWDVSQTTGEPVPERPAPRLLKGQAPEALWDGLAGLVESAGYAVVRVPDELAIHGANGMTNFEARTVSVRQNMDPAAQVKTLAHELAHVRMHGPDNQDARRHRGIGEVEADSVALMIAAAHGMDTSDYTIPYVAGWASTVKDSSPVEVVKATGERVRAAAVAILDSLPTVQVAGGDPPGLTRDHPEPERPERPDRAPATTQPRRALAEVRGL
jgi:hypothetical protein